MSNVISLMTRKPWHEEQQEKRRARRAESRRKRKEKNEARANHKLTQLQMLDEIRKLVEEDKFEGLMIFGRDPKTKVFFNDFVLDVSTVPLQDYFAYAGLMQTVAGELMDCATMAPAMLSDGTIEDPYLEPVEIVEMEGDFEE